MNVLAEPREELLQEEIWMHWNDGGKWDGRNSEGQQDTSGVPYR